MFHEERERPVLLVVDQRPAMQFGTRHCFKSVLAAELAALLAWSALSRNERVGGLLLRSADHWEMRPRNSRRTVLSILSALAEGAQEGSATADQGQRFADLLRSARRVARPGSSVFILSDFDGLQADSAGEELFQLARHTEISAVHCSDPLEASLPPAGQYTVTDGNSRIELDTGSTTLRERFQSDWQARLEDTKARLQRLGIPMLRASTVQPPLSVLRPYFGGGGA
jgi:uncharacterized protein (DUF58 family)